MSNNEKKLFSEGKIEIERVINEKGQAVFLVRFPQAGRDSRFYSYKSDVVIQTESLEIGGVNYEPVISVHITTNGDDVNKHYILKNLNDGDVVMNDEQLKLYLQS